MVWNNPTNVEAIPRLPIPKRHGQLETFLGMLQLQCFFITVQYVNGKVSDYLSPQSVYNVYPDLIQGLDHHDAQMRKLNQTKIKGWLKSRSKCNSRIFEYWNNWEELSMGNDLIFRGQTLRIPQKPRQDIVQWVHTGHLGLTKTIQRAKDSVFLPGIQNTLKNTLNCSVCLIYKDSNAKEQMIPTEFPDIPYQTICADQYQQLVASSLL